MIKARKAYGDRVILDDVTLSFLPGAKIGVVGPNGMGKSTLLKIMAGIDTVSNGEAYLTPGFTVGILQQEPPLDETKTVGENIKMAFGEIAEKVARFNQIGEEMANPDADFDSLMEEMGKLQNDIDAANGWDLDSQLEQAMDALQCPDPDTPVTVAITLSSACSIVDNGETTSVSRLLSPRIAANSPARGGTTVPVARRGIACVAKL